MTASQWQKNIEGSWYGIPAVFDANGDCVGHIQVDRASVHDGKKTTYTMNTRLEVRGPLRSRFEAKDFAFDVLDGDRDRVYLGPDFFGCGQPSGSFVDAHYYSPGWMADLVTMVHVLEDGITQVYSSQLYEGPALLAVFNGMYRVDRAGGIEAFLAAERAASERPHVLPFKDAGVWTGKLAVYGPDQKRIGDAEARVGYRPRDLLHADVDMAVTGAVELAARYGRGRVGNRHTFEGPDLYGNGMAFGRALYTTQHFHGRPLRLRGREFLLNDHGLAVVWHVYASGKLDKVIFGELAWQKTDRVIGQSF
jgi:hypothetical protein